MDKDDIDYSRKWLVMAAVGSGIFLSTIDGSIVNLALPTLVRDFGSPFALVEWVILAYLLTISTLLLSVGRLGDMVGKKPLYTAGFVIFTIGSMLCGIAPSIYWLIFFRVFQGLGAVTITALGLAILTESFPADERGKALGIGGAVVSVGIVVGPVLGGLILGAISWRWIFYVNLPVGVAGTLMALSYVPGIKPAGGRRFDYLGAVTLFVSLFSLLTALTWGQFVGLTDRRILLLLANAALFAALFVFSQLRAKEPLIALRLFRDSQFSIGLVSGFITFVGVAGATLLLPFYLEDVLGYDPAKAGIFMAVVPLGLGITAPLAGSLSDRFGTRLITVTGLAGVVVGYYALSTLEIGTSAAGLVSRFLPIGIGMGIFQSPNNSAIMGSAARDQLGIVSSTLAATRTVGQTSGVALLGALWASRALNYASAEGVDSASSASAGAQAAALQDTYLVTMALVATSLLLALVTWYLRPSRIKVRGRA
jgi:EmrB/QacA subfamily drug resistance transporter